MTGGIVQRLFAEQRRRRTGHRRLYSLDHLPMVRVWMHGRRWRRHFGVREVPIAEFAPSSAPYHRPGKKLLVFSLEDDVRELVLEELRPGVYAEWSDPRDLFRPTA